MYYGIFDPISILFHVVFWILFVWFVVWLIRGAHRRRGMMGYRGHWHTDENCDHPSHGGRALEMLKERFVKGEISKEEFEEKKNALM